MSAHPNSRRSFAALAALTVVAALLAGCGGGDDPSLGARVDTSASTPPSVAATTPTTTTLPEGWSQVAEARNPVLDVFAEPNAPQPSQQLPNPWAYDPAFPDETVPQVFLVKEQRPDGWVKVLLPVRPNGSTGWVRYSDVTIEKNPYSIRVELGAHKITVMRETDVVYEGTIAVGKPSTPTPTGEYYLRLLLKAPNPNTVYGPFAYGLSSYSEVLETFNGGDAEIGIHGNDDASVLGSDVTSGCMRMDNEAITMLSKQLPLGTPVNIFA